VPSDVLTLRGSVPETVRERVVGSYAVSGSRAPGAGLSEISLAVNEGEGASFYRLSAGGAELLTGELVPIAQPFKYLPLLSLDIAGARAELFDSARAPLYTVRFEPSTMSLCVTNN
jgi:hypothetical protein